MAWLGGNGSSLSGKSSSLRRMSPERRTSIVHEIESRRLRINDERKNIDREYKKTGCPSMGIMIDTPECLSAYRKYRRAVIANNAKTDRLRELSVRLLSSYDPTHKEMLESY